MLTPEFDIILLGATGYTGTICAEHITYTFPTTFKWAIAGRSASTLDSLAARLEKLYPDRFPPTILVTSTQEDDLRSLVRRTRVVINSIGPYHLHSEPVVRVSAEEGVHYIDFSTETPWISEMVHRYDNVAKRNHAIVIPAASLSSSPSDLLAWIIASKIKEKTGKGTKEIVTSGKLTMAGMGGGSVATVLSTVRHYGIRWLLNPDPYCMLPPQARKRKATTVSFLGPRKHDELGTLTTSMVGISNSAIVQRSGYLRTEFYGKDFTYEEYLPAPNYFAAIITTFFTKVLVLLLALPFIRAIIHRLSFEPGAGPDWQTNAKFESANFDAVGEGEDGTIVRGKFVWKGALVHVSAILVAEAAVTLLEKVKRGELVGNKVEGMQTASLLGEELVERLRKQGCVFDVGQ